MKWYPIYEECVRHNARGGPYEEASCLFPYIPYTHFETKIFSQGPVYFWMEAHPEVPIFIVLFYLTAIYYGQLYFKNRPAWNCRRALAIWNFSLSLFSIIGFSRTAPLLYHYLTNYSLKENFCFEPEHTCGSGSTGFWVQLFALSKIPELVDTFFIVVHKKPLLFLHWYHHVSVLLYCWHSYVTRSNVSFLFGVMNYAVHAVMYGYYFLMAIQRKPKWFSAFYLTVAQISQMVVGVSCTLYGLYLLYFTDAKSHGCLLDLSNNAAAFIMYGSYLYLFLEFFLQRYFGIQMATSFTAGLSNSKLVQGTIGSGGGSVKQKTV